ncbi:Tol-Pal system beta propeller repeat protein TolB [Acidihalobacter ferrooxydans]|uniref:Tol-Pal system protein TolB n=1 Tax=Acidihalobacter ferrooxydans TaxID=1765967 RepID=A0A1P8UHT4_9GAMM|nr:Tol-Pal system beta propeller repeat protein TolB [Acidihalobacter ferrooxydans]APZ43377.1 Tol-Pal system beta propeller repeat protein TolB [Acidihalobacter ferrooxydans]
MKLKRLVSLCVFSLAIALFASSARADLNITITQGAVGATPIGIVPFAWSGKGKVPQKIGAIVSNDLLRSGLFAPLAPGKLPQQPTQPSAINFNAWTQIGVSDIVIGGVQEVSPGQYAVRFQLFDTLQGQQLLGYTIHASKAQLRQAAHRISDLVYQKLTGQRGAFNTHIAYVSTDAKNGRIVRYRIMVADADGHDAHVVYSSKQPLSAPTWSPNGKYLAYVSFENGNSAIYIQNLATAKRRLISDRPGLNSAPAFSPDGSKLAMTLTHDGHAEIYVMNLATHHLTQITHDPSINTGAAWMPNGQSIVFTSDRGGSPQLYVKSINGGAAQRLTFDGIYNAGAAVSPSGGKVAFVHANTHGGFSIGLLNLNTGQMQNLTHGQLDESPSFAPNGSMVLYSTVYQGKNVLAEVSADGRVRQRLSGPNNVSQPAWSPFGD